MEALGKAVSSSRSRYLGVCELKSVVVGVGIPTLARMRLPVIHVSVGRVDGVWKDMRTLSVSQSLVLILSKSARVTIPRQSCSFRMHEAVKNRWRIHTPHIVIYAQSVSPLCSTVTVTTHKKDTLRLDWGRPGASLRDRRCAIMSPAWCDLWLCHLWGFCSTARAGPLVRGGTNAKVVDWGFNYGTGVGMAMGMQVGMSSASALVAP
jgi:hypothetical protein